jgi:hypothetical protein
MKLRRKKYVSTSTALEYQLERKTERLVKNDLQECEMVQQQGELPIPLIVKL